MVSFMDNHQGEFKIEIHIKHNEKEDIKALNILESEEELNQLIQQIEEWFNSED